MSPSYRPATAPGGPGLQAAGIAIAFKLIVARG